MQRVRSALTRSFPAWTRGPACSTSSASGSRIGWRLGSPTCDVSTPPDGAFDLIWCEGAIYNVGFEAGLRAWRRLLVRGGHVAVTEVCWRKPNRPAECAAFWNREYPANRDLSALLEAIDGCGYETVGHFPLPASAW